MRRSLIVKQQQLLQPKESSEDRLLKWRRVLRLDKAFIDELKLLGLNEGENIHVEIRLARPNTGDLVVMAEELAKMDLALIVAASLPIALEVRKRNPKMPMILCTCPGMVSNWVFRKVNPIFEPDLNLTYLL
jgi:ABC-type uncharacterized transport system substrate-binding protein